MTRQRRRAAERSSGAEKRRSVTGIPVRSARSASRLDAVKSSARAAPHTSPITPPSAAHFRPSSIVQSTSPASRAHTRTSRSGSAPKRLSPPPCGRPASSAESRSWTHKSGFPAGSWASAKPIAPASPPLANTSVSSARPAGKSGASARSPVSARSGGSSVSPERRKGETRLRSGGFGRTSFTSLFRFCSRHESSSGTKSQCPEDAARAGDPIPIDMAGGQP